MKLGALFSGGKDSLYAAYIASKSKENEIACLISVISENKDSYMFHTPNINLVEVQAEAMKFPLVKVKSKGEKEKELKDLKKAIKAAKEKYKIEGIVTGAIASNYQATRIQKICDELGLRCLNPLWQKDQIKLIEEMLNEGIKFIIIGVAAYPLDEKWLGQEIDKTKLKELKELQQKMKINPAGEGGEFETFVLYSPLHKKKIKIVETKKHYSSNSGFLEIKKTKLV